MFTKLKSFFKNMMSEVTIPKEETYSMSIAELKKKAERMHPVGFYVLASNLFKEGKKDESILWFYVGSLRYRYFLSSIGDSPFDPENELFGRVQFEIGSTLLDYAGGDPEFWAKQVGEANKWDDEHSNLFFSKTNNPEELVKIKENAQELELKLLDEKDDIIRQRIENGAEVRV